MEDCGWQALSQLQLGGSKEVGAGYIREYREGRQELAGASQVIVAELAIC